VRPESLPEVPPDGVMPGVTFPPVGPLGRRFPTCIGPMLREDCPWLTSGSFGSPSPFPIPWGRASCFVSLGLPRLVCKAGDSLPRRESFPRWAALLRLICPPGDPWLSQVPASPLGRHAPLSAPGGVLTTRRIASRTAAFRSLHTVGFCLDPAEAILLTTTRHISGLDPAACFLLPSSFVCPLLGVHVECAPDLLARR